MNKKRKIDTKATSPDAMGRLRDRASLFDQNRGSYKPAGGSDCPTTTSHDDYWLEYEPINPRPVDKVIRSRPA